MLTFKKLPIGRFGGCLPRQDKVGTYASIFEEQIKIIPRKEWSDIYETYKPQLSKLSVYQYDQNGEGTCTSNAGNQAYCYMFAKQFMPKAVITTSPIPVYKRCARGPNTGSSVSCIMKNLRDVGTLPIDNKDNREKLSKCGLDENCVMDAVGFYQKYPKNGKTQQFISELKNITTFLQ